MSGVGDHEQIRRDLAEQDARDRRGAVSASEKMEVDMPTKAELKVLRDATWKNTLAVALIAAEAELETLRAERDDWKHEYDEACKSLTKRVHQGADAVRREKVAQARLDRAVEALRVIRACEWQDASVVSLVQIARAVLEEIDHDS